LQRNIIRLVLVGLRVATELQKRQCTVRSQESIIDKLLYYGISLLSYIYSGKRRQMEYNIQYSEIVHNSAGNQ
jgi:hypothetical protein